MQDRLLTPDQVSQYLSVHRDTVYAMIRSGRLPALQLGGRKASWRISESDLMTFIASQKAVGPSGGTDAIADEGDRANFDREQADELVAFQKMQADNLAGFERRAKQTPESDRN